MHTHYTGAGETSRYALPRTGLRAVQRRLAPARLPLAVQLRILVDVARGLQHAHQLKAFDGRPLDIVHRDVSPQNIMLTYEGQVKLLDFGIAKANGSDELTRDGMIKGKVDYMAPEQLTGAPIDARADVFPLGVLLWEAITGARFSGGAEVAEVTKIHNRVMGTELRVGDVAPDAPTRLVEICNRAVSVDRHNRQASAEDFANELGDYLAETSRGTDSRKLADILAPVFEKDRAKIRNIIDEQVRLAESADDNEDEMSAVPLVTTADSQAATPHEMEQIAELKSTLIEQQRARELDAKSSSRVAVIASLCVAALVGVVGAMAMKSDPPTSPTSTTPEATARAVESRPESPARAMIAVNISVTPEDAEVTLDGSRIVTPFAARIESDGRIHHVIATAAGFAREERAVVFDQDRLVTIALEPAASDAPVADTTGTRRATPRGGASNVAVVETRPAAAPQAVPRDPTPATPPTHMAPSIDSDDPYQ